jgi:hypothetical protein
LQRICERLDLARQRGEAFSRIVSKRTDFIGRMGLMLKKAGPKPLGPIFYHLSAGNILWRKIITRYFFYKYSPVFLFSSLALNWSRLSEQKFRVDKWRLCRG